ncbi:hypothetical protein ACFZB9_02485 [Kitasatospora sp. NPDC008050]|uniref:hypothetical protein n=1 Tax=Kitasatospora sp. NPDC008050 TaxID=3364021 RepID=UPI0036E9164E
MPRTATATSSRQVRHLTTIAFFGPPVIVGLSLPAADPDRSGIDIAAWALPVVLVLFELLVWLSRRAGLRRFEGR